jgi:hypothetical protein
LYSPLGEAITVASVIHFTSASEASRLPQLLEELSRQTLLPSSIILVAPISATQELEQTIGTLEPIVSSHGGKTFLHPKRWIVLRPYDDDKVSDAFAVAQAGSESGTDLVLVVDASQNARLSPGYVEGICRAACTSEYGGALLSSGGVSLKSPEEITCAAGRQPPADTHEKFSTSPLSHSARVHLPIAPFLVRSSWLASSTVVASLRNDLPYGSSIALALNRRSGIPAFAIPFSSDSDSLNVSIDGDQWASDGCRRALEGLDSDSLQYLARKLRAPVRSGDQTLLAGEDDGTVSVIAGVDDLDDVAELACGLSSSNEVKLLLVLESGQAPPRGKKRVGSCRMQVEAIVDESNAETRLDLKLALRLEQLGDVDAVFYLDGSQQEIWIESALRRVGATFAGDRGRDSPSGGAAAIRLPRTEVQYADWISALPGEALRSACLAGQKFPVRQVDVDFS